MSDAKYSIDDILREARKIRAGGVFEYEPSPVQEETAGGADALHVGTPAAQTVTQKNTEKVPDFVFAPSLQTRQKATKPMAEKEQLGVAQQKKSPATPMPTQSKAKSKAEPIKGDFLAEIAQRKARYNEHKGRIEPRENYQSQREKSTQYNTPDANAPEKTLVINTKDLKNIVPVSVHDEVPNFSRQAMSKTQMIHPEELGHKPNFDLVRKTQTQKQTMNDAQHKDVLTALRGANKYTAAFHQTTPPKGKAKDSRFIKGSIIHKSMKTDEILFSKEPPSIIEKPAVMKGKTRFEKTGDLQSIPEIMSVEDFTSTMQSAPAPKMPVVEDFDYASRQIRLDGFENDISDVEKIEESDAEEALLERRQEQINHFKLFGNHHPERKNAEEYMEFGAQEEALLNEPINDYNAPAEKESIIESLNSKEHKLSIRTVATGAITVSMVFFSVLETLGLLPALMSDSYTMLSLLCIMTLVVTLFNFTTLLNGLGGLLRGKIDADFPITVATLFVVIQSVFAFVSPDMIAEGLPVYPMALSFAFLCHNIGKQMLLRRVHANFEFLTASPANFTVQDIENSKEAQTMCNGLLMGDPVVKHSVKTGFATRFLEIAYQDEPADKLSKKIAPFTTVISIAIGVGAYFLSDSWALSVSAVACASCISVPVVSLFATNLALLSVSKKIKSHGAMVNGYCGASQVTDTNAIVFDAADLFPGGSCDLHGIKTFGGMRVDDAILQTAAVVISTKGPLQDVFDKVIVGKQAILPEVDTVVYEERMGTSGWIYGKKVLVGNRQLLINHGVKVPSEEFEAKYKHDERYLLYLCVAGKVAAMFAVSYTANSKVKEELVRLEKSGITVLVRTADPNINEEMLTHQYGLTEGFLRVLNSSSGRIYEKYSENSLATAPAYLVHNGTANAFISAMYAGDVLCGIKNILSMVQIFGIVIGLVFAAVFSLYGGLNQLGALNVVLFQSMWALFVILLAKYKR